MRADLNKEMEIPKRLPIDPGDLRAIVTDVDGTLYDQRPVRRRMARRLLRAHAAKPALAWKTIRCLSIFRRAQEEMRSMDVAGQPHAEGQYARTCERTGYSPEFVRATVTRWMEQEPLACLPSAVFPDCYPFFSWIGSQGLNLAAVSDYPSNAKLCALQLDKVFHITVCPADDPALRFKPHPSMLLRALQEMGVPPGRALYIGDRPEVDGVAAKAAGMLAVIVSSKETANWRNGILYVPSFTELQHILSMR